jgi:transposase-like protein
MAKERFSDEVKETIVRLYNNGNGKEIKDLAIEYGVPQSTVRLRKKEMKRVS